MPVSVSVVTAIALKTLKFTDQTRTKLFYITVGLRDPDTG